MIKQKTIKKMVSIKGVGLHTGNVVNLTMLPAPSGTGIVYRRIDLDPIVDFFPSPDTVKGNGLCTQIFSNDKKYCINTVEHINAALSACGIDNLIIEVDNVEIPILDGSSYPFIYLILEAGIEFLNKEKEFVLLTKKIEVKNQDKIVEAVPYNGLFIDFTIDFPHPFIRNTNNRWAKDIDVKVFINELSKARTFGFLKDIEYLQSKGMCLGGSLDNAIVLDEYRMLNETDLRYPDEFVRHKVLDSIGDLFVCGKNVLINFKAYKSGHELNNLALREIIKNSEIISIKDKEEVKNILYYDFKLQDLGFSTI